MIEDIRLLDLIKEKFNLETDLQVASLLGINENTVYGIRNQRVDAGKQVRLRILKKCRILDRLAYRVAEDFLFRLFGEDGSPAADDGAMPYLLSTRVLVSKLREFRLDQIRRLSNQRCNDSVLLDEYKLFKHLSTDMALADIFELGRNSISMVRNGRNSLGERPRLIIFSRRF